MQDNDRRNVESTAREEKSTMEANAEPSTTMNQLESQLSKLHLGHSGGQSLADAPASPGGNGPPAPSEGAQRETRSSLSKTSSLPPPKREIHLYVGLSAMQRAWYTKLLTEHMEILNGSTGSNVRLLNVLMQLRKVCNHPYLFPGAEPGPPYAAGEHLVENSGKLIVLDKLLQRLRKQGSRVVLCSQMTRTLDILEDYCALREFDYCRMDGMTQLNDRDAAVQTFNAPDSRKFLFLISTRCGAKDIRLQTADTVVFYDSDWNGQMDEQVQNRVHCVGQTKLVHVYRLITENTVEEKLAQRAAETPFLDATLNQQGCPPATVSSEELLDMLRFGAADVLRSKSSTVSDVDIGTILERGIQRTRLEHEKLLLKYNVQTDGIPVDEEKKDSVTTQPSPPPPPSASSSSSSSSLEDAHTHSQTSTGAPPHAGGAPAVS